jgi:hypothetical protein
LGFNLAQGWKFNLMHLKTSLAIENKPGLYLMALSEAYITPGGPLQEGFYSYITDKATLSPNATVIVLFLPS